MRGHKRLATGPVLVKQFLMHDPVRCVDLAIGPAHAHLGAFRVLPDISEGAARSQVDLAGGQGPTVQAGQPALDERRLGEGVENQPARCVKGANDANFPVAMGRDNKLVGCGIHVIPPSW
ncbi:hypothetical protein D3C80_1662520 [compost metagenome]